jgi:hypothetical protein
MSAVMNDLEFRRLERRIESLDDVDLVHTLMVLLGELEDAPDWGRTPAARAASRVAFTEIANRWIPEAVLTGAVDLLDEGSEA